MSQNNQCKLCKEEIKNNAKICVHCGSYQNWKRYLNFSSIILSLFIAVFTLSGFTYPYLKEKLQPLKTELKATLMGTTSKYIYILFSNTGNRPGTIKNIYYTDYNVSKKSNSKKSTVGINPTYSATSFKEFVVIEPGESRVVELPIDHIPLAFPEYLDDLSLNEYKSVCMLSIDSVAYDASSAEEINIYYPCISHNLKDEWFKEELSTGIRRKDVDILKTLENRPDLYEVVKEHAMRDHKQLIKQLEQDKNLF